MAELAAMYKIVSGLANAAGVSTESVNSALMHAGWAGGKISFAVAKRAGRALGVANTAVRDLIVGKTPDITPVKEKSSNMSGMKRKNIIDDDIEDEDMHIDKFALVGDGQTRRTAGQETQITSHTPGPAWPFGMTYTTRLHTKFEGLIKGCNTSTTTYTQGYFVRPTSLYDIAFGQTTSTYAGASGSILSYEYSAGKSLPLGWNSGTSAPVPAYRPLYEQLYKKYCVLSCDYRISLHYFDEQADNDFNVSLIKIGVENVPTMGASDMLNHPGVITKRLRNQRLRPTPGHSRVVFEGTYKPGDYGEDVVTDALAETWTSTAVGGAGSNPTLRELLGIYIFPSEESSQTSANVFIEWDLNYTVQFKGPYLKYQYPTKATTIWDNANLEILGRFP